MPNTVSPPPPAYARFHMVRYPLAVLALCCVFGAEPSAPAYAQTSSGITLQGQIVLPASRPSARRARGQLYRNRLGGREAAADAQTSDTQGSIFEDVIVAAFPLSFEAATSPMPNPVQIHQEGATFIPNVTPVTVGTVVQFVNDDDFFHNVFSLTPGSKFNIGRRATGETVAKRIDFVTISGLGPIELFCDIHPQMNAIILSLDTPYFARANADGTYALGSLPPGDYRIEAYHPQHGTVDHEMTFSNDTPNASWTFVFSN